MDSFKSFVLGLKKKTIIIALILVAIGIPVTITLLGQQQDIRQRAQEVIYLRPTGTRSLITPTPTPTDGGRYASPTQTWYPSPTGRGGSPTPTSYLSLSPTGRYASPTPTQPACPLKSQGDANCDGKVNTDDFNIWRDEFLQVISSKSSDFNNDGIINTDDFNIWREGFLNPETLR